MLDVPRATLLAAARDCAWPPVELARFAIAGEASWRTALDRATPGERRGLLARLAPHLTALGEGARRTCHYALTSPETPTALRRRIRHALQFHGDEPMFAVTVETLARFVPEPVRAFTLEEVCFVASGWSTRAWTSPLGLSHPDGRPRSWLIVLSGVDRDAEILTRVLLHETAHAWYSRPTVPGVDVTPLASGREAVLALANEEAWPALAAIADGERQAETLALAWLCAAEAR